MMTTNRIPTAATTLALLLSAGVTGCSSSEDPPTAHLAIVSSDSPDTVTIDATEGATETLQGAMDITVEVEVVSVEDDEVELSTSESLAPAGETGGMNLNELRSEFTATAGEELQFSTPTTDGGTTWTTTLEEGPAPP